MKIAGLVPRFALLIGTWLAICGGVMAQSTFAQLAASTWEGTYTCYQGETGLALTFEMTRSGLVGTFAFHAVESNPGVPDGRFRFTASVDQDGTITATQSHWVTQPPDFMMVDFTGRIDEGGTRFDGTIDFDGCTTFATVVVGDERHDEGPIGGKLDE